MNHIILSLFPLIALIASGYLFKKYHFLSDGFWVGAEKLNYYILFPALLFKTLSTAQIELQHLSTAIIALLIVVFGATLFIYLLRVFWEISPARFGVHVQSLVRFNTYIGLALVMALFQHEGVAILAIFLAFCIPLVNVISVFALTPKEQMAIQPVLLALVKNPLILSCIVGALVNVLHIPVWIGIKHWIQLFSVSSLPLGLLCVGAALQFMQIKKDFMLVMIDTVARLLLMPIFAYWVCQWLDLPILPTQVLVIFFALPTAPTSYILTKALGGDSQLMAAVISVQTLCAAVTLPLVLWWVH